MRNIILLLFAAIVFTPSAKAGWKELAPGMELGTFAAKKVSPVGDSKITVLRIDPKHWELVLVGKSQNGEPESLIARDWSKKYKLTAAINAGMFALDHTTHVGYHRSGDHVNNSEVNEYKSVAAFGPKKGKKLPEFRVFDLDMPKVTMATILRDYSSATQNLRLIKKPGSNRWGQQKKMWSEAALGEDKAGRILFVFSRSPYTMHDFNRELLALGIGVVAAQHLEGGPEAQLFLEIGDVTKEMVGSYETAFQENDDNATPWPVPNILGIRPKQK